MSENLKPDYLVHGRVFLLLPQTDNVTAAGLKPQKTGSIQAKATAFYRSDILAIVSCIIYWLYLELQVKESNKTPAFINYNIVHAATQTYLKQTNLLINHHHSYKETQANNLSKCFSGQTSNHSCNFQTLNLKGWFTNICTGCNQLIKADLNYTIIQFIIF